MTNNCEVTSALVFGTGKEHAIAGNAEFCRELVAKPVGLPVGQRDFRHGESAAVVKVNGGGNLFHTEVGHRDLMMPPMPSCGVAYPCKPMACAMGSDMETTCASKDALSNSSAMPLMIAVSTFSTPALDVVRM